MEKEVETMSSVYDEIVDREDTNAEKYRLREALFHTTDVLPMWVADMDIATPKCVRDAVIKRAEHGVYGYEEMPDSAYEAQIEWIKNLHNFEIKREWIFYSHSVVASINVAIQAFTSEGEGVVTFTPIYPPFMHSVTNNRRHLIKSPLKNVEGRYEIDFEHLEGMVDEKTKLLLLCSPHNPVGRVWDREELIKLGEFCLERGIVIFSDEIHSDIIFKKHTPFGSINDSFLQNSVTAIGVGKTFNLAGLAISTVVIANEELRKKFDAVYESIHFAQGTVFGHVAFESAYRGGRAWRDGLLEYLQGNFDLLENFVDDYSEYVAFRRPEGTYLAWLDFNKLCKVQGYNDKKLREFIIKEAKLGLSAGSSFSKEGRGFMRLNAGVPRQTLLQAIKQLSEALEQLR